MIRLEVEDYCQNCKKFTPDIDKLYFHPDCATVVACENRELCNYIHSQIYEQLKKEFEEKYI